MCEKRALVRGSPALVVAAAMMLIVASCGSSVARPGPSPTVKPAPTTTPAPSYQALVGGVAKGIAGPVDLYDSTTGQTRLVQVRGSLISFADRGRRVSYLGEGGLYSQGLDGTDPRTEVDGSVLEYGWGPDNTLAYVTSSHPGAPDDRGQLVIRSATGLSATADLGAGVASTGIPQQAIRFSPDGKLVMVAQTMFGSPALTVRRLDGTILFAPQGTHGAWAADGRLYYSNDTGIHLADPATGASREVVRGVRWYNPSVSPDGRYVVFEQQASQEGVPTALSSPPWLQVLDTQRGAIVDWFRRDGGMSGRFVTPTQFWFQVPVHQDSPETRPVLAYDLAVRAERQTGLAGTVWDVRGAGAA